MGAGQEVLRRGSCSSVLGAWTENHFAANTSAIDPRTRASRAGRFVGTF